MSIEEKLSKIKAINEEIDYCEKSAKELNLLEEISFSTIAISHVHSFTLPASEVKDVIKLLQDYFDNRKSELIEKAKELMK